MTVSVVFAVFLREFYIHPPVIYHSTSERWFGFWSLHSSAFLWHLLVALCLSFSGCSVGVKGGMRVNETVVQCLLKAQGWACCLVCTAEVSTCARLFVGVCVAAVPGCSPLPALPASLLQPERLTETRPCPVLPLLTSLHGFPHFE